MLTKEQIDKIKSLAPKFKTKRSLVLPALYIAQEGKGHVTPEDIEEIALLLDLPKTEVYNVATYYTMYNLKPVGKYHVQVCTNLSCSLLGSEHIVGYLEKKLGIKVGETSEDKKFTLNEVECLGSCGTAPMMQINDDYYENLTEQKIDEIVSSLK